MSSEQKFKTMLEMQIAINDHTVPGWKEKNLAWRDAIWIECAELMDHIGWKWWKKQEPNLEQAKMEVVDIWHFGMSLDLTRRPIEDLIRYYESREDYITLEDKFRTVHVLARQVAGGASDVGNFKIPPFFKLMNKLGMSLDDLYTMYVGKNVLNKFRQDNGYKEGRYIKDWIGEEDNKYLVKLLKILNPDSCLFISEMEKLLTQRYSEVKAVHAEVMLDNWGDY